MFLLAKATQSIPLGTAYAVWVGIGALGTALCGIMLLNEPLTFARLVFIALLLVSIVGLKVTG
jgi:quaternary ammonium compound-resistance protein SugE